MDGKTEESLKKVFDRRNSREDGIKRTAVLPVQF